jgi:hypothetical protein
MPRQGMREVDVKISAVDSGATIPECSRTLKHALLITGMDILRVNQRAVKYRPILALFLLATGYKA